MNTAFDIKKANAADAWYWAFYSEIQLASSQFELKGHEFQAEIMNVDAPVIVAMKATQMYFTETFVLRTLHNMIHEKFPKGVLYLFPTKDDVLDFSASRFKPLIRDNPETIGIHVRDTDRANLKRIGRGHLYFRGAKVQEDIQRAMKAARQLVSIPVDHVVYDEWDLMDERAEEFAKGRMADSEIRTSVFLSNPTIPDYGIDKKYQQSDQRAWFIKCRKCNQWTCLENEFPECLIRIDEYRVIRACKKCREEIFPMDGQWVARKPEKSKQIIGYNISHLCSVKHNPKDILDTYEDPETKIADFYRRDLGKPYIEAEDRLIMQEVYNRCHPVDPMFRIHPGPTASGVDVAAKWLHVVVGYRVNETTDRICYMARVSSFNDLHDINKRFNVQCCVINYEPDTHKTREFREDVDYQCWLAHYNDKLRFVVNYDSDSGLVQVNRTEICDRSHDWITISGRCILPRRSSEVDLYAQQMSNMAKVLEEDVETGARAYRYRKLGDDDYRHATNYFLLARDRISIYVPKSQQKKKRGTWEKAFDDEGGGKSFMAA